MHHYHVLVKKSDDKNWTCIFKDLSKKQLKNQFIRPYKLGRELFYDGNILPTKSLKSIRVIETEKIHSEELKLLQDESHRKIMEFNRSGSGAVILSLGYGYDDSDIKSSGNDVTSIYINKAPGSGTISSRIFEFIKHPWVVRIVGPIIVVILAYIGLK